MAKMLGDRLLTSIVRGGYKDVKVTINRGAGAVAESLWPSTGGQFYEEAVYDQGLDGSIDIKYWKYELLLEMVQCDAETLADLYSTVLATQWRMTGVSVEMEFMNGSKKSVTMRMVPRLHNDGYQSYLAVTMKFNGTGLTALYQA